MNIEPVDPGDPAGLEAFYAVYAAASRAGPAGGLATIWQLEEVRVAMVDPDRRRLRLAWAGWEGGSVVATGWMEASTVDNTDLAMVLVCADPDHRGHGHATAMLDHVEDEARALGRSRLIADITWAYSAGTSGDGSTDLHARVPDHVANRLRTYLDAPTRPRAGAHRGERKSSIASDGAKPGAHPCRT